MRNPWSMCWFVAASVGLMAVLLAGCASARHSAETCRQERQRSKQIARSSFCEQAAMPRSDRAVDAPAWAGLERTGS